MGGFFEGAPLLILHSTGAKSGEARVHPMMYQAVDDAFAVFASYAGGPKNPAWFHNLVPNPDASVEVAADARMGDGGTEAGLLEETLGLSNPVVDRKARRAHRPSVDDERSVWERRRLVRQWNLDQSELRFHGNLAGVEGKIFDQAIDDRVNQMGPNP